MGNKASYFFAVFARFLGSNSAFFPPTQLTNPVSMVVGARPPKTKTTGSAYKAPGQIFRTNYKKDICTDLTSARFADLTIFKNVRTPIFAKNGFAKIGPSISVFWVGRSRSGIKHSERAYRCLSQSCEAKPKIEVWGIA